MDRDQTEQFLKNVRLQSEENFKKVFQGLLERHRDKSSEISKWYDFLLEKYDKDDLKNVSTGDEFISFLEKIKERALELSGLCGNDLSNQINEMFNIYFRLLHENEVQNSKYRELQKALLYATAMKHEKDSTINEKRVKELEHECSKITSEIFIINGKDFSNTPTFDLLKAMSRESLLVCEGGVKERRIQLPSVTHESATPRG